MSMIKICVRTIVFSFISISVFAADVQKADNSDDLNLGSSWVSGTAPSAADVALWDSAVTSANSVDLGADITWDGLKITNPGGSVSISGTNILSLDGGAAVDIDMENATQDLVFNSRVEMADSQDYNIAAGRCVVFNNSVTNNGETVRMNDGTGTMVIRDDFVIPSGDDYEQFGIFNGTVVLDGADSALDISYRFFFGKNTTDSDATLIVSNGNHIARGTGNQATANFIGVSDGRGDLIMEGGSLSCVYLRAGCNRGVGLAKTNTVIMNGGTLSVSGTTSSDLSSKAFTMGANHVNDTVGIVNQSVRFEMNGGLFETPNGSFQIGSRNPDSVSWQGLFLNGGTLAVKKLEIGTAPDILKEIYFNGGLLQLVNVDADGELINGTSNLVLKVQSGGAVIDSGAKNMTLSQDLIEDPASVGGGFVKLGTGSLTLAGSNSYKGKTIVSNGTLKVSGDLGTSALVVIPGGTFSMADSVISEYEPAQLTVGEALAAATVELEVAVDGSANDCITLSSGSRLYKVGVRLISIGTADSYYKNGSYPVFKFSGAAPAIGGLFWDSAVAGYKCEFAVDSVNKTVVAEISYDAGGSTFIWMAPGSGSWETAANWSVAPVSGSGAEILFGSAITADSAVALNSAFTLGELIFGSSFGYTLNGTGSFMFDGGSEDAEVMVNDGDHSIDIPVALNSDIALDIENGSALTLGGALSGSSAVALTGEGTVSFEAAGSFSGGVNAEKGMLLAKASGALGTGAVVMDDAYLRVEGPGTVSLANDFSFMSQYNNATIAVDTELDGAVSFGPLADYFYKWGDDTLTLNGSLATDVQALIFSICEGSVVVGSGGSFVIDNYKRDAIDMSRATDGARGFIVESGAVVEVAGIYTGGGPSNTVWIKEGGTLSLHGSSSEVALLQTLSDEDGTDRIIVDGGTFSCSNDRHFSLGVRGGDAEIILNSGYSHFGNMTFGVRTENTFGSSPLSNGRIEVNDGLMVFEGYFNWMGDINSSRINEFYLNGGELRLPATMYTANVINQSYFVLNGGSLVLSGLPNNLSGSPSLDNYLKGVTDLVVGDGGADIDTAGLDVTILQQLKPYGISTGGLIKRGAGALTFTESCSYTGPTVVEEGTLSVGGLSATSELILNNGTTLSLAYDSFDDIAVTNLYLGDDVLLEMELSTTDSSCDQISIPAGSSIGKVNITLFDKGTHNSASANGTYPLFDYTGTPPDISGLELSDANIGVTCVFVTNMANTTIDAVLSYTSAQVVWDNAGSGDWSTAANWWPVAPAASGSSIYFVDSIISNSTVNVDSPVSVSELLFNHSFAYTLSGSAITIDNPSGEAFVNVASGTHNIESSLTLSGSTSAEIDSGAELIISGMTSGSGPLSVEGGGMLTLNGTNSVNTTVTDGATLSVASDDGYTGTALTLNGGTLQIDSTDIFGCGIAIGPDGGAVASLDGETLTIDQDITGSGGLDKVDGGTVSISAGVLKYTGETASDGGTLRLADLPAGDIVLGGGTLDLQSISAATTNKLLIDSGSRGAVLDVDGSVTISGDVSQNSGAMIKFGSGTVAFTGAMNDFGDGRAVYLDDSAAPAADGDGPTVGFGALNVAAGKLVLGASGQTNTMAKLYIGIETTDQPSSETAGELEIVGGVTTCSEVSLIGRRNGSSITAPDGLSSRLRVDGGDIWLYGLHMGTAPSAGTATAKPVLQVDDGLCTVGRDFNLAMNSGITATVEVNGGTLIHESLDSYSIRLGHASGATGILRVDDGFANLNSINMGYGGVGCTGIVEVSGGVLQFDSMYNSFGGYGRLLVDGGTLRPSGGSIANLDLFEVGANPLILDTSLVNAFYFSKPLTGSGPSDGGLIITGGNVLKLNAQPTYSGPTIVSNGTLRTAVDTSVSSDVIVMPNGVLDISDEPDRLLNVPTLTLGAAGDSGSANVILEVNGDGSSNDVINVTGALTLYNAAFNLYIAGTELNMFPDGTYNLIYYGGADPDISGLSCANPLYGKDYIFSASSGVLSVTIGNAASGSHIWTATGSGSWDTAGNWLLAPGAGSAGTEIRFDSAITADSTITLGQPVTLGAVNFNNANKYTLSGTHSITMDSSTGDAEFRLESGTQEISAPMVLNDNLLVRAITSTQLDVTDDISGNGSIIKYHAGVLNLTGQNSYTGSTEVLDGMLRLDGGTTLGEGDLIMATSRATLGVAESSFSVLDNNVQFNDDFTYFNVNGELELSGELNWNVPGTLFKGGSGMLTLSGSALATNISRHIQMSSGTLSFASGSDYHLNYTQREAFNMISQNNEYRKIVFEPGSYVKAGGMYFKYGMENRVEMAGTLDLVDDYDALSLRVSTSTQDRIDYFAVQPNGVLTTFSGSWVNVGVRGPAIFTVDGGVADVSRFSMGYQSGLEFNSKGGHAVVKNGGLLNVRDELNWMGDTYTLRCNSLTVNGSGSVLRMPATRSVNINGWSAFGLNGGSWQVTGANPYGGSLSSCLAGLDVLHVGAAGGTIDTDDDITITQSVSSDGSTNAVLVKAGSGTLSLASPLAWAGDIDVQDGALVAELDAAEGVVDPTNILYRANFECGPNQDTSGNARHGLMFGSEINLGTTGPQSDHGLVLNGNTCLRVPFDSEMIGVTRYTVAGWIWLDAYSGDYKVQTFFTTRLNGGANGPDETMLRVVDGKLRFMYGSNGTTGGWKVGYSSAGTIPLGEWVHFAVVTDVDNVKFYFNGQYDSMLSFPGYTLTFAPDRTGTYAFGMALGCYSLSETSAMFKGRLDDMRVYTRTLGATEIAEMVLSAEKHPDMYIAAGATLVADGSSQVDELSGEGFVEGALTVNASVAPGDLVSSAAGAVLTVDTLNLASNVVYACTWSEDIADAVIANELNIEGAGVVDLGRDSGNPIPNGTFRTVLMSYDTISGEANLNDWTLINAGVGTGGLEYDIFAEDGEVVLTITNIRGTVIIVR
jgi:fibronectin-binding autotransporter adhesin